MSKQLQNSKPSLISARWVVPVEPRNTVLENHSVLINGGVIEAILPTESALKKYPDIEKIELHDHVLMPGLVNAHTHAAMSLFRGLADDRGLDDWLQNHIWPAETKWVDSSFVRDGTELAVAEMLRGGTTMFSDMYFYPKTAALTAQELGMRACIGLMVMDFPTVWGSGPDEYFSKGLDVHDEVRSLSLISTMLTPHAPYTVSDEPLQKTLTYADELQIPIHMHVHETRKEVDEALLSTQIRPLARLENLGLLNPRMIAVHMTQLLDQEIESVAELGVHVVHCPSSNAKLASGQCRINDLLNAGVNVALGTDGAASNNSLDMFSEMRLAALMGKQEAQAADSLPAWQVLEMATINGAKALDMQDTIGSLVKGKRADLCAVNLNRLSTQPVFDPISQLVYCANRDQVSDVWVDGKRLLASGSLQTINEKELIGKVANWATKIRGN